VPGTDTKTYLISKTSEIGIMTVVHLTFMIDHRKEIIFVHAVRPNEAMNIRGVNINWPQSQNAHEAGIPPFSFSASRMYRVVYGAIFSVAGKRICVPILRVVVLSVAFCSKRYACGQSLRAGHVCLHMRYITLN
jgi:hypothetical protein